MQKSEVVQVDELDWKPHSWINSKMLEGKGFKNAQQSTTKRINKIKEVKGFKVTKSTEVLALGAYCYVVTQATV